MSLLSSSTTSILSRSYVYRKSVQQFLQSSGVRYKMRGRVRGIPLEMATSLTQRLEEINYKDPELNLNVNIGFQLKPPSRKDVLPERIKANSALKQDINLEIAAKAGTLEVPLDKVCEEWQSNPAVSAIHLRESAYYFNIFSDLFGDAHFVPVLPLKIAYEPESADVRIPVCRGNIIKPTEANHKPKVSYTAKTDDLYCLEMTTPDCHFSDEKEEYLHWFVANIPGSKVEAGEEIVDYMQPFPPRGAGFCRYIFVLYKQDAKIDLSKYRRQKPCTNLAARSFNTYNFYREFQDVITPCGLAFFQADWDANVTPFYHNVLEMKEPVFEYDFAPRTVPLEQEWFPHRRAFNIYLDKYKEEKVLQKELLIEKLQERHPFEQPPKRYKYPNIFRLPVGKGKGLPTWKRDEITKKRMLEGKYKFM